MDRFRYRTLYSTSDLLTLLPNATNYQDGEEVITSLSVTVINGKILDLFQTLAGQLIAILVADGAIYQVVCQNDQLTLDTLINDQISYHLDSKLWFSN